MPEREKKIGGFVGKAKLIAAATVLSRVLGVLRTAIFGHIFGEGAVWDGYTVAFMVPNLFRRLFGEGALSAAFIPVYSAAIESGDEQSAQRLGRAALWLLVVILASLVLIGEVIILGLGWFFGDNPDTTLTLILAAIVLPYVILICLVALIGGMLNARYHFSCPALAPVVLNIVLLIAGIWGTGLLGGDKTRQIFAIAAGVLIGGIAQLLLVIIPLKRRGISLAWLWQPQMDQIKQIIKLTTPMILGLAVLQVNALLDYLLATWLSAEPSAVLIQIGSWQIHYPEQPGAVSVLYYAQRLYNMPLGVFGVALATAIFPYFTACAARKDHAGLVKTLVKGLRLVAFIGIAASVGLMIISRTILEFIPGGGLLSLFGVTESEFSLDAINRTVPTLMCYCLGIWAYCGVHVVVRGFYALKDTLTPVKVGVWLVALNIPLNLILIWPLGTAGLALSTAICAALNLAILTRLLSKKIENLEISPPQGHNLQPHTPLREVAAALPKIILATALMAAATYAALVITEKWVGSGVAQSGLRLAAAVITGLLVYYLASRLLRSKELDELRHKDS